MIQIKTALPLLSVVLSVVLSAVFSVLCSLLFGAAARAQEGPQPPLPNITLQAGLHLIKAEVARTPQQVQTGMMFRREMGNNEAMLFVFGDLAPRCFWMKNTLLPLSIAFLADDGQIVQINDMQPRDEASHCTKTAVRYALEMNQGWFAKRGVKPGMKLKGAPFVP